MNDEIKQGLNEESMDAESVIEAEKAARRTLEEAREAEIKAYQNMGYAAITQRQRGVLELAGLEKQPSLNRAQMDRKCRLLLESYYLPHILKDGYTVKLDEEFTRFEEPERDYIEAAFTDPSGRERRVGYNYKVDEDGSNLILFEKTFQNLIIKPGDPEKYVVYEEDGVTERETISMEELEQRLADGRVVKVDNEYFQKFTGIDGEPLPGKTTPIVEEEDNGRVKTIIGNNEQEKYSFDKDGRLVRATTNDVTTITTEVRKIASNGPVFSSADEARAAAERELQEGEVNLQVDVSMEGTTIADFDFLPAFVTSIELKGLSKKMGKGVEGYDPNESDEENLRRQLAVPIQQYLEEKGYHVIGVTCENLEADVKENVGWMNTIRVYQMTGGTVSVTYIKKTEAVVTLKQGFLGRGQNNDSSAVLAQLPEGSELLNPQDIDWKSSKPTVYYFMRGKVRGSASATTIVAADDMAAENAIVEAQKIAIRGLNGGIPSGLREAIAATGAVATVANVRARLESPTPTKADMRLTHESARYSYSGTCDRPVSTVSNQLVAVTTWNGEKLSYVEATEPVVDKGIPTDDNYDRYVNEGDELGILLFEKSDRGLRRYIDDVREARIFAKRARGAFEKAREELREAQEEFDRLYEMRKSLFNISEEEMLVAETLVTPVSEVPEPVEAETEVEVVEPVQSDAAETQAEVELDEIETSDAEESIVEPAETIESEEPLAAAVEVVEPVQLDVAETQAEVEVDEIETSDAEESIVEPAETIESEEPLAAETVESEQPMAGKVNLESEEDVEAAWAKLLQGM